MLSRLRQFFHRPVQPPLLDAAVFADVFSRFGALQTLDTETRTLLQARSAEVLASKAFHGAAGFEPDAADCLAVALLAALPVLRLGIGWYRDFHTFILYPSGFVTTVDEVWPSAAWGRPTGAVAICGAGGLWWWSWHVPLGGRHAMPAAP